MFVLLDATIRVSFAWHLTKNSLKKKRLLLPLPYLDYAFQLQGFCSQFVCDYIIIIAHTTPFTCLRITTSKLNNFKETKIWKLQKCNNIQKFFSKATQKMEICMKSISVNYSKKTQMSITAFTKRTIRDFYPVVFRNSLPVDDILSNSLLANYLSNSVLDLPSMNLFLLKKL